MKYLTYFPFCNVIIIKYGIQSEFPISALFMLENWLIFYITKQTFLKFKVQKVYSACSHNVFASILYSTKRALFIEQNSNMHCMITVQRK